MRRQALISLLACASCLALVASAGPAPKYKVLHNFNYGTQAQIGPPGGSPALDSSGRLYGGAGGGTGCAGYGCGVIYRLAPDRGGWKFTIAYDFLGGEDGAFPQHVLFSGSGDLFGTLAGDAGLGDTGIYELVRGGGRWTFDMIYPGGDCLVLDQTGNLYGCFGSGMIGELSPGPNGWTYTDIYYSDCNSPCYDGDSPVAPLTWDSHGDLYGTTLFGGNVPPLCPGSGGCGVAFQLANNGDGTWTYHVLHRFAAFKNDGYYSYAGLTVDGSGNAYGLTSAGGKYGNGTFYKLTPTEKGPWKETILYEFPNCANGCGPAYTLVSDKAGNFYSSGAGGNHCGYDCGTVFKFSPQKNGTWKYSVVHKFTGADGAYPYGVVLDDKGNIFGTTMNGGKYNLGVAFEITP